mmetsp:Transcript_72431/g.155078  ORF Transcript_72431/g.155078 Transcript_72431/m.155078 type:complete len:118 (+) Transcript_72431:108-461(+)
MCVHYCDAGPTVNTKEPAPDSDSGPTDITAEPAQEEAGEKVEPVPGEALIAASRRCLLPPRCNSKDTASQMEALQSAVEASASGPLRAESGQQVSLQMDASQRAMEASHSALASVPL